MANESTKAVAFVALVGTGCYHGHPDPAQEGMGGSITASDDANDDASEDDAGAPAGDTVGDDAEDGGADAGTGGDDGPGSDAADGDDGSGDGSDGIPGDDDGPQALPLAADIALSSVQVNQGVATALVDDGVMLAPAQRNAALIAGRPTLVRAFWELQSGFSARELEGRLLVDSGGTLEVFSDVRIVDGPPDPTVLDGGFLWELPADALPPDATVAFEIVEPDGTEGGADASGGARVPADGFADLGLAAGDHVLSVTIVPLGYGNLTPDLGAASKAVLEAALYDQNPATELDIEYHALVDYPYAVNTGNQLGDILGFLSNLKQQEGAGAEVYYAGVINIGCFVVGCGNAGTTGIGYIPGANEFSSLQRVSANVWYQPESSSDTVVHELGHNQGLSHVACPFASSSNTDPAYPHASGNIGGWGWGVTTGDIVGSDAYDYMAYCGPSWVSDWTWNKTEARIATLSSWADAPPPSTPAGTFLLGHHYPDGSQTWFQLAGQAPPAAQSTANVRFSTADGFITAPAASGGKLSDGLGDWVAVNVPAAARDFEAITVEAGAWTSTVDADDVRFHAAP